MSKNENENLQDLLLPKEDPVDITTYERDDKVCAVKSVNSITDNVVYKVLSMQNRLYNPSDGDTRRNSNRDWKLIRTNATAFTLYVSFLEHKRIALLRQAERSL